MYEKWPRPSEPFESCSPGYDWSHRRKQLGPQLFESSPRAAKNCTNRPLTANVPRRAAAPWGSVE
jgi:hypothetical protein